MNIPIIALPLCTFLNAVFQGLNCSLTEANCLGMVGYRDTMAETELLFHVVDNGVANFPPII